MKRNWLIFAGLVVGSVLLLQIGCQEQVGVEAGSEPELTTSRAELSPPPEARAAPDVDELVPEIRFEKVVHGFGDIGPETRNVCGFKFTNTGGGLLKITSVSKTCGCTPYTLEKTEYAPGESGTLKVKYYSGKRPGPTIKRLFVFSNDKTRPKVTLTISANVVLKVAYEPKQLKLLLNEANAGCPEITLTSLDNQPFAIKDFKSTGECITADYDSSVKSNKFVLEPKVDIEKLQKALSRCHRKKV